MGYIGLDADCGRGDGGGTKASRNFSRRAQSEPTPDKLMHADWLIDDF